ncbi:hypothetical protein EYB53_020010 [Candidatus Chloroploca sp. M-50]|uniref:Uncharacterized protein n=1 Tax=Candidatus Chloroploca mongolica TaxID=2528176 RepID=A0ABS4DF13_9CHLR|nr:hypothetical protein [Candidatus Chloroploca mongolica]MBP1468013.1 hypothetical protein [Candidatus Chloroploca mongolica]
MSQDLQGLDDTAPELASNEQPPPARRAGEEDVRRLIEGFVPDSEACRLVLTYLSDLIGEAHGVGAERWAITIRERLRFIAGLYFVLDIERRGVGLALDRSTLQPEDVPRLQQLAHWDIRRRPAHPVGSALSAFRFPLSAFRVLAST